MPTARDDSETWAQENFKKKKRDVLTDRCTHKKEETFVTLPEDIHSLLPTTSFIGKNH